MSGIPVGRGRLGVWFRRLRSVLGRAAGRDARLRLARGHRRPPTACCSVRQPAGPRVDGLARRRRRPTTNASTVGPAPETTAGDARVAQRADERERLRHGGLAGAAGAGSPRWRAGACSGRPPSAATSRAARPVLAVASACGTAAGSRPRATSVRTPYGGTKTTAEIAGSTGARWAQTTSPAWPETTNPPSSAGATLSGWPSSRLARARAAVVVQQLVRHPATSARASTMPPTIAAEDEPSPRLCGIAVGAAQAQPGRLLAQRLEGGPHRADDEVGLVAGDVLGPLALDLDLEPAGGAPRRRAVSAQLEGQPEAVEPGSEVGAGGGHLDGHRPVDERPPQASPAAPRPPRRRRRRRRCRRGR